MFKACFVSLHPPENFFQKSSWQSSNACMNSLQTLSVLSKDVILTKRFYWPAVLSVNWVCITTTFRTWRKGWIAIFGSRNKRWCKWTSECGDHVEMPDLRLTTRRLPNFNTNGISDCSKRSQNLDMITPKGFSMKGTRTDSVPEGSLLTAASTRCDLHGRQANLNPVSEGPGK